MATIRTLKKTPPVSVPATVVPLTDISITWSPRADGSEPRTITGAELGPILEWLYTEAGGGWATFIGLGGDAAGRLGSLCDLLGTYATAEAPNGDGEDLWALSVAMRSLVERITAGAPPHATVTIASRGEVAS
jgi:hypothetical protein